jgi:2,3-dihydroxy-p-cumate/2,3-dihydroxybenzoate 3,4-dioxygenase
VALNVSDLGRTSAFAEDMFGLAPAGSGPSGERRFRCSSRVNDLILFQSDNPGFRRAGWELEDEEQVDRAFSHFEKLQLAPRYLDADEADALGFRKNAAFRIREPHSGAQFDYFAYMEEKSVPFRPTVAKISRLGHFALNVPDAKATTQFYVDQLGFEVSDYVGDQLVTLLRAFPNPLHHSMGIGGSRTGQAHLNHINFMVTDIDDIGRALYRFRENDVPIVFGPGRHPTSDSIFIYALDPDGMTWEYSFGMELFPETGARKPRFMSARAEDFDMWGARPAKNFASSGAIHSGL